MQAVRCVSAAGPGVLTCALRQVVWRGTGASVVKAQVRHRSAEALTIPVADGEEKIYPEKLQNIVSEISQLTLLEVADLNQLLRKTLNIPDAPMMAFGSAAAAAAAPKEEEEEEEAAPVKVQTSFTVRMNKYDETKKVPLIKEVKARLEGFNLVQAKKFVESCPCVVKADIPKDEAEALVEALKAVGAECVVE